MSNFTTILSWRKRRIDIAFIVPGFSFYHTTRVTADKLASIELEVTRINEVAVTA